MASEYLTPVQTVSEVGEPDIESGFVIINLESYGANIRLALGRHQIGHLVTKACRAMDDLFDQQQDDSADVIAFPGRAAQ